MRIALCSDQYLPMLSGIADSIDELARELRLRGHQVRIYGPELPGALPDEHVFRFPASVLPGGIVINLPRGAMRDLRAFDPDVIHTHLFGAAGFLAWYAARKLRVPLVGTDHTLPAAYLHFVGLNWWPFPSLVKRYAAWYYNRCDTVITPGDHVLDELRTFGMTRPATVISNPISAVFRPLNNAAELKAKHGIAQKTIVVFGRIAPEKNLDAALDIFSHVARKIDAHLLFIGEGAAQEHLEERVRALGLSMRVRFLNMRRGEELTEILNACDLFLITSKAETQSMVLIQAMACGLPAVAANAGGLVQYVHDGETGYLVDPDDTQVSSARVLEILSDGEKAARFSRAAIEAVAPLASSAIAPQFEAIYQDVIDQYKK